MKDIALTGVPRGGTTLACKLLGECRETVALAEPIQIDAVPEGPEAALACVRDFFAGTRRDLEATGRAPGKLVAGGTAANFFGDEAGAGRRQSMAQSGELVFAPPPRPGFTLAIKHNAFFTALLPELATAMPTIALIRHPLPVLASWQTVELPVADGRLPAGERFDPGLRSRLRGVPDILGRQLHILDWVFARFASARASLAIVKYEDIVASQGQCLFEATGVQGTPRALEDQNASPLYHAAQPARLAAALADFGGAWNGFYSETDDARALQRMLHPE